MGFSLQGFKVKVAFNVVMKYRRCGRENGIPREREQTATTRDEETRKDVMV